jgi:hypothetical protein
MKSSLFIFVMALLLQSSALQAEPEITDLLTKYQSQGAKEFSAEIGKSAWSKETGKEKRACTSCHGSDLTLTGKHVKTGKIIKPMASSTNSARYSKEKKIEKWFKRNCKWTWGRECTPQEKGNFLTYLSSQ